MNPESKEPGGEVKNSSRWHQAFEWLKYVNNILLLPMFSVMIIEATQDGSVEIFASINEFFCALFLLEWAAGLALSERRLGYLRNPSNIADLLSSIPFVALAQSLRVVRLLRLFRIARLALRLRRFQGKSARMIRAFGFVGAVIVTGALAFRVVEPQSTEGLGHALWWSVVTLSTVGYGDVLPTTPAGRVVATCLIFAGVGVFGYMAGFMTSLLDDPEEDEILETVKRLELQLAAIQAVLGTNGVRTESESGVDSISIEAGVQRTLPATAPS